METEEEYKTVYVGYEVNVQHLQSIFEETQIDFRVKNEFQSALRAGFSAALPGQAKLLVASRFYVEALKIVEDTFPSDENE